MDTLKVKSTVVVPALPVNGRTTYMGYHFVCGRLISDSPLKDHPLNPMRNPDLVNFLQRQTRRKVGLVPYDVVKLGSRRLRGRLRQLEADGFEMIVVDAVEQKHLTTIFRAVENDRLITGGSGIAMEIPRRSSKETSGPKPGLTFDHVRLRKGTPATLVVAGSCSPATLRQNAYAQQHGFKVLRLEAEKIVDGDHTSIQTVARLAVQYLDTGQNVLVHSTGDRTTVEQIQRAGRARGWSMEKVGRIIADALARITRWILDHGRVNKLIVAGGETSGHICRKLRLTALEVGCPIDPGVPYCFSREKYELVLVLKSGNFGEEDFYVRTANILTQLSDFLNRQNL
jgi:3-dehydrotetronate 4-kinase